MIINNLNFERVTITPNETNAILIVDADAVLKNGTAFEVEFSDRNGRTYQSLGLRPDQLMVLYYEPDSHLREPVTV